MPVKKTDEIIPDKNGRWPKGFLESQKQNLETKLSEFEKWNRNSIRDIRDHEPMVYAGGNEGDCAQTAMETDLNTLTAECSAQIISAINTALSVISRDLKSSGTHKYGTCEECGQRISSYRLESVPWANLCVSCQKEQEEPDDITTGDRTLTKRGTISAGRTQYVFIKEDDTRR